MLAAVEEAGTDNQERPGDVMDKANTLGCRYINY